MKGNSKVIMGAAVVLLVTLAIVLGLVLVLLAELYCSRRRRKRAASPPAATAVSNQQPPNAPSSLCSFYAHGVLRAHRSFLFPARQQSEDLEKQMPKSHHSAASLVRVLEASSPSSSAGTSNEQLMYICNPIYDDGIGGKVYSPPFETPDTSPSRLGTGDSPCSSCDSPPLTPMKKLPDGGSSVCLRDARSACTTAATDSNSNNHGVSSSSKSASPSSF